MGGGDLSEGASPAPAPVSVRARFERFPATIKGAFILRGEDPDPHQVIFRDARIDGIGLGVTRPMPIVGLTLDVAPHRDVFVPFEMQVGDLDPGWYTLVCDLDVDGTTMPFDGGRRFSVAWPRATVRRGQVKVDRSATVGDAKVTVESLDCLGDHATLQLRVDPPGAVTMRLSADGDRLEILETEVDHETGRGRVTAYPILRAHRAVEIALSGARRGDEASIEVPLED